MPLRAGWKGEQYPSNVMGMRDDFRDGEGNEYMACDYPSPAPKGAEIASMILQTLAYEPQRLANLLNHRSQSDENAGRQSWKETFFTVMQFLY